MIRHALKHLDNVSRFKLLNGGVSHRFFEIIDRELILKGYDTSLREVNDVIYYCYKKDNDEESYLWFAHGTFERAHVEYLRKVVAKNEGRI